MSIRRLALVLAALSALGALVAAAPSSAIRAADAPPVLSYVGSAACASCHPGETKGSVANFAVGGFPI